MMPSAYGWYVCNTPSCPEKDKNIKVHDLILEPGAAYGYRIIPICKTCKYDLGKLGRGFDD